MDDEEYYALSHRRGFQIKKNTAPRKTWQGPEDEDMLREKQTGWNPEKDDSDTDYSGTEDDKA